MEITDYLAGVYNKNIYPKNFPPKLEVPKDLGKNLTKLYKHGEKLGREHGQSFELNLYVPGHLQFSPRVVGVSNSCDPPRTRHATECGDMHSHPSRSIGHVDGYSAHSLEDYRVFQYHLNKPVFIRLVSSGPWLYAVVYRSDLTRYQRSSIDELLNKHTQALWEYFEMMNNKQPYGDNGARQQILGDIGAQQSQQAAEKQMVTWKVLTPGFGTLANGNIHPLQLPPRGGRQLRILQRPKR